MDLTEPTMATTNDGFIARLRNIAKYEAFPELSARVRRWLYHPLGILVLADVAALLCGLFLHPQGLVLFGGVTTVIVLGLIWPWLNLKGLHGSISFEEARAIEGEPVAVLFSLRRRLPWSSWGLAIKKGFDPDREDDGPIISVASVPGRCTAMYRWLFTPMRRGVYPLVPPYLTTGFPFGLWESELALEITKSLLVWPRTYPVEPIPIVAGEQQTDGKISRSKVGSNGDVLGVRPYRRGDSPRRIHWRQSARHDRLIVCELQSNARPVIMLILDAELRVHAGRGADGSREWAIRIVASFAKGWLEAGAEVGTVWNGHVTPPAAGQAQLHRILDSLAELSDEPGLPLAEVLASQCQPFSTAIQVIVTTVLRGVQNGGGGRSKMAAQGD